MDNYSKLPIVDETAKKLGANYWKDVCQSLWYIETQDENVSFNIDIVKHIVYNGLKPIILSIALFSLL